MVVTRHGTQHRLGLALPGSCRALHSTTSMEGEPVPLPETVTLRPIVTGEAWQGTLIMVMRTTPQPTALYVDRHVV